MVYAIFPTANLHARNVPEQVIHFVESNCTHLQHTLQQQQMYDTEARVLLIISDDFLTSVNNHGPQAAILNMSY